MANKVDFKARKAVLGETVADEGKLVGSFDFEKEVGSVSDAIKAAIAAGDVIARKNEVTRKVGDTKYRKEYLQLVPINFKGMSALANGVETTWKKDEKSGEWDFDGPCAVKDFFYGNDLGVKSKMSQRLAVDVLVPDTAMKAAAKQLAKAFGISEDEALEKVRAMQPAKAEAE
jgi:hypothetical protein